MVIAVASDGNVVSPHFGRSTEYTIYQVEDGSIQSKRSVPSLGHDHTMLVDWLKEIGAKCVIAGGMGMRVQEMLAAESILTMAGYSGPADDAVRNYLAGVLPESDGLCNHEHHEGCESHKQ